MIGFSTIYTSIPVFALLFDQEVEYDPYQYLAKGRFLNFKRIMEILWWAIYQGSTIAFLSAMLFQDSFANIVAASFCSMVVFEWLHTWSQLNSFNFKIFLMQLSSLILYSVSVFSLSEYFDRIYLIKEFFLKVITVALVAFLPYLVGRQCLKMCESSKDRISRVDLELK